jgi:hypothetical protein
MNKLNFSTMGTFGDTIYSLCAVKLLGGGNLYVKLNALDEYCRTIIGWPNAGPASGRYTEKDYQMLEPLLNAQDYLDHVAVWNNEEIDCDFIDHWKMHLIQGWQGNQTECYGICIGKNIHDPAIRSKLLFEPWLTPVEPIKIPGRPIVVNRTNRHLFGANGSGWHHYIKNRIEDYGVFIGTDSEHDSFENTFKITIPHCRVNDLLEMAQVIQGSELFIGNQSCALSIAIGLGKSYHCEIREDYESTKTPHGGYGDTWFPRINGFYF